MAADYCPSCGMRATGAFCPNCGSRLGDSQPAAPPPPVIRASSPASSTPFSPYADRPPAPPPSPPPPRPRSMALTVLGALLGAGVVAVALWASGVLGDKDTASAGNTASPGESATSAGAASEAGASDPETPATPSSPTAATPSAPTSSIPTVTTTEEILPWPGSTDAPDATTSPHLIRDHATKKCRPTGRTIAGYPVAACRAWQRAAAMWAGVSLAKGSVDIVCQRDFPSAPNPQYTAKQANTWWFWAQAGGTWDWFPETALSEGGSNLPVGQVAVCQ